MIFVTVGEQLPFDRLIRAVDQWAVNNQDQPVFAQIGRSPYRPQNLQYKQFLEQCEFRQRMHEASFIIAHAGMGTIISALEMGKPIIVMPRRAAFGEHRNDHQLATARRFLDLRYVAVAFDEDELQKKLLDMGKSGMRQEKRRIDPSPLLMKTIRDFLASS